MLGGSFYALVGWIGGVVTTLAGTWIGSKIHVYHENRTVHLDAIRGKVLIPLRSGFEAQLKPLLIQQVPVVSVVMDTQQFKEAAKVTEDPTTWGTLLVADFPFGRILEKVEPALLHDARTRHFIELMTSMDRLSTDWISYGGECHIWVSRMAARIGSDCGLPPFLPNRSSPYVMNYELANFVHRRLFRLPTGSLQRVEERGDCMLRYGSQTVATGTVEQIDALIVLLDGMAESEKSHAAVLQGKRAALQTCFNELSGQLDFAIASQRLHGRCDLLAFF